MKIKFIGFHDLIKNKKATNRLQDQRDVRELERARDSLIFLDEFYTLFDLDDRKKKRQIERTFRLINHNNNTNTHK